MVAGGADICDNQCAGDAQCRGWNYVKANPKAPGVCEFISSVSTPVPSQISISGLGVNSAPISSRVMQGGSNTVRVGTTVSAKPRSNVTRVGNRRVVREAVPQQRAAQNASTQRRVAPLSTQGESLTAQQNRYRQQTQQTRHPQQLATAPRNPQSPRLSYDPRVQSAPQAPRFRPMLDGQGVTPQAAPQQRQMQQGQMPPRSQQAAQPQTYQQQGYASPQMQQQRRAPARSRGNFERPAPQQMQRPQMPQSRAHMTPQRPPQSSAAMPRASAQTPVTHSNAPQAYAQRRAQLQAEAANYQALTAEQAQQSLFGSLHDDVKVPAVNSNVPTDPDAPMATQTSRPSVAVVTESLDGLAGAAPAQGR
ncbi:hypothetical protein AB8615_04250 [Litorimonas sp. RW-G-Af-16]|uniref:hypothetical protein n=1 Tax=Litorimonas sp. RW-G-Af-16 TaxID=3241168 RepID=UPI003AAC5D70